MYFKNLKKLHKFQKADTKQIDRASTRDPIKVSNFLADVNSKRADNWEQLSSTIHKQALKHFGSQRRKKKDWFSEDLLPLVEQKRAARLKFKEVPTRSNLVKLRKAQQNLQRDTRKRVNNYWFDLCEKVQVAADSGNLREMYDDKSSYWTS